LAVNDRTLTADDYRALAEFRYQIRQFLHFSEKAAGSAGLNPQHHQLLLALKGIPKGVPQPIHSTTAKGKCATFRRPRYATFEPFPVDLPAILAAVSQTDSARKDWKDQS
jgi:hypothetical protein